MNSSHSYEMGSHTPGPWRVLGEDEEAEGSPVIEIAAGDLPSPYFVSVAYVRAVEIDELTSTDYANANLIAAAPELLEALKAMVNRWEPDAVGADRVMWESACAAIARAEGRS